MRSGNRKGTVEFDRTLCVPIHIESVNTSVNGARSPMIEKIEKQVSQVECQVFVDPLYGSERYITFEPSWVVEVEDRIYRLMPWRKYPVTFIKFRNGKHFLVSGHWAERIKAAQNETTSGDAETPAEEMKIVPERHRS